MVNNTAIVTMEGKYETTPKLSNGSSLNDLEWPPTHISRSRCSTSNNSETMQDRTTRRMADRQKVVYDLSNGVIFNYLEQLLPRVSRSRHSLTLNISAVWLMATVYIYWRPIHL